MIILVQTVVIVLLSGWIYEEYLNNRYLREYVNGVFQTEGWAIAVIVVMVALGAVTLPLFLRSKTIERKVEPVFTEPKVAVPVPDVHGPVATQATHVSSKPGTDFHPVVAALKADLAGRPLAFGTVPASSAEEQRIAAVERPSTSPYSVVAGPRPELGAPVPAGVAPASRTEEAMASAGTQPLVAVGPITPRSVTTVITGVVPAQKKKAPEASSEQKPSSH
jgi:hypothetical protein